MEGATVTTDWLGSLEDRVRDAAEELRRLREENEGLRSRLERLEAEAATPASTNGEAAAWPQERNAIRVRVERLVEQLEEILED
jgi:predicted  nucleic acid-binding Zn-ribbon protein